MNSEIKFKVNWDSVSGVFAVPNEAVDYIKLANEAAVKVLLLLLRYGKDCTAARIKNLLGYSEETIEDALSYWEQLGMIVSTEKSKPIAAPQPEKVREQPKQEEKPKELPEQPKLSPTRTLTPKEIAERIESSQEISFLFSSAEACLGRMLNHTEHRSLIWIVDFLGLPPDVVLMLIEYCKSINKTSMRYIETIAVSWQEKSIYTHEAAAAEIENMAKSHTLSCQVASKLGLNRSLISKEQNFVNEWSARGITIELITYAYEKTVEAIGKLSFAYMNKIILTWLENGLKTIEDIDEFDAGKKKELSSQQAQKDKESHSYDLDMFDAFALEHTPKLKGDEE